MQGPNISSGERDKANISIVAISITYILFEFFFSLDTDLGIGLGIIIALIITGLVITYFVGTLGHSLPKVEMSVNSFLDFLNPKDPDEAFTLLKTYAVSGLLVLTFSLFGPWFVFEGDWRHEPDSYFYSESYGNTDEHRYGLWNVKVVEYDDDGWSSSYTDSYNENGLNNRKEVASKASNIIISAMGLWIFSILIFLYFISNRITNTKPRIENLTKIKRIQEGILLFSEKLERLKHRGIDITSLGLAVEEIGKSRNSLEEFKNTPLRSISVFLYALLGACIISMGIAVFAYLQFGETWAEAMHSENGGNDGFCGVCEMVDSFTGSSYETQNSSSGTFYITYYWGGGWGRRMILWLGTLTLFGILRNSLALLKLSRTSIQEIATLEKTVNGFSMPEL